MFNKRYSILWVVAYIVLRFTGAYAQNFINNTGGIISDRIQSEIIPSFFQVQVTDLPFQMNDSFGLEKVCLHIRHQRPTDLKIELLSPQGTSVWLSNRNGSNNNYGYLNTCIVQNGFNGEVHNPERLFEGEYSAEGRMDFFNNGQNPNGVWLLIITDLQEGTLGKLEDVNLSFGFNPASQKKSPCSTDNQEDCFSSHPKGSLLPDLTISQELTNDNIYYFNSEDTSYPNQLRFAAAMANIGEGPLEIITTNNWYCDQEAGRKERKCPDGSFPTNNVQQVIYRKSDNSLMVYDTIKAGVMYYDDSPGHNHYHVKNWANFKLLKKRWWSKNPSKWKVISSSNKVSYCLFDNKNCTKENEYCKQNERVFSQKSLINYGLGRYASCNSKIQGISVGGIDYYGMFYEGQSIELPSNIKKGKYYLYIEVDPYDEYLELNEDNNEHIVPVIIN